MLEKYYTEKGLTYLQNRLQNLVQFYMNKPKYPYHVKMYGSLDFTITCVEHHQGMIDNMCNLLGLKEVEVEVKQNGN
jgi:hypothetical protein